MAALNDMAKQFKQMSIDTEDINILLMGETGVGKSTFINAFANYMEYDQFDVAEKSSVRCLIPSSFTVIDENMKQKLVKIGRDKNENEEVGVSATQGTRSYVFPLSKYGKRVRLIDTPGVGDTRGLDQDSINFENILSYIANMKYLHAICFLLKPNNSRITVYFEYCIKQLLSRLEKSASQNIIFLFTNSRSTFYRPGDTAPALKKILDQIRSKPPHANIEFTKDNVFCLDNEAFRFMVSYKEGIRFTEKDKESFSRSWEHSVAECWRMIDFIAGVGNSKVKLVPHKVQDTMSVNNARRIIIQLSQPLADIADLINDNINLLQRHNNTLAKENVSMTDLKKRMYVPVVNLRHKELKQPTTVCTNAKCSEIYMVADKKKYHYKQRCHDPCYLTNVPAEMIGSPELVHCYAMLPTKKCRECGCDFTSHMHIYYLTETYEDKITDTGIQSQITDRETAVKEARKLILKIESRKLAFEEEKEVIVKNMAKFAHFLQHNAIAPYNDAYKAYIDYLIDRENSFGNDADTQLIMYYQDLLKRYDEEKQILDDALQMSVDGCVSAVTSDDVFKAVQTLYDLQHMGAKIKELVDKQKKAIKAEFEDNTECVLDAVQPRNINPSIKGVGKKSQKQKFNKRNNTDDESDEIPPDVKEKFRDILEQFPEMEEFFARKHRQKSDDEFSTDNDVQPGNNKNQKQQKFDKSGNNEQGVYRKGQQNNPNQQNRGNMQKQNRGRGQNHNQGRGNYNNKNQNYGNNNRGSCNQGFGPHNQNNQRPNQNPRFYNRGPGPHNQNQGREPYGYNQGPGSFNQNSGPYSQGPEAFNQGPGPYHQGPGPYNRGPGPFNQGPGPFNQGPGRFNQGPGPFSQGPPLYYPPNNAPRGYNHGNPPDLNQAHFNNQRPYGPNLHKPRDFPDECQGQKPRENDEYLQVKQNNLDKNNYSRPSGPYQLDVNEKDSGVDLRHMDKFLNDCETSRENPEEDDAGFHDFMKQHGLLSNNEGAGGMYEKNLRGGGRGRGRGGRGRGRGNRRSKSSDRFDDADSDSGQSYSSRGSNKSYRGGYKRADHFEFVKLDEGPNRYREGGRNRSDNPEVKKGVLDFFKGIF